MRIRPLYYIRKGWLLFLLASLTVGLAPFTPEPHIVEKIRWIVNREYIMEFTYIFDLFMHGIPWVLLIMSLFLNLKARMKN